MSNEERGIWSARGRSQVSSRAAVEGQLDRRSRSRSRDRSFSIFQAIDLGDCVGIAALLKEDVGNALAVSINEDYMNPISYAITLVYRKIPSVLRRRSQLNESFVKVIKTLIEKNGADMQPENDRDSPLFRFLDYERVFTEYNTWFLEILYLLVDNTFSIDTLQLCKTHVDIIIRAKQELVTRFVYAPDALVGFMNIDQLEMHQRSMTRARLIRTLIRKQISFCHFNPLFK
jgi:hypothetical protein